MYLIKSEGEYLYKSDGWDGMGWDGMGYGMGWDMVGWDGMDMGMDGWMDLIHYCINVMICLPLLTMVVS